MQAGLANWFIVAVQYTCNQGLTRLDATADDHSRFTIGQLDIGTRWGKPQNPDQSSAHFIMFDCPCLQHHTSHGIAG